RPRRRDPTSKILPAHVIRQSQASTHRATQRHMNAWCTRPDLLRRFWRDRHDSLRPRATSRARRALFLRRQRRVLILFLPLLIATDFWSVRDVFCETLRLSLI